MSQGRRSLRGRGGLTLFGLGRKRRSAADQLKSGSWHCAQCGADHGWPFDLAAFAPDPWTGPVSYEDNAGLRMKGDFLSEDFCVLGGEYFMIRAVLLIPVQGLEEPFGIGCWSTLSRTNFEKYIEGFDDGTYPDWGPWSGWLCNQLADYVGPDPLAVSVEPRKDRQRALLWVQEDGHPLAVAQDQGITPERVLEIFAYYGHGPKL
ncbi:DUF2199 domain-containing protein [Parasphingopyxis marina]|uniref:DUF2199 domain-containing protein n=1 Tax=Parasphingopyxis marina TaxID=2761622 RepID=A0A842HTX3_9SPHN|nr:DUF2199 domain-containing protein [Parasphingopyxis marina]MBC2776385.1 DUF2199 domain-containing protein [Parasphingopyxis marina]